MHPNIYEVLRELKTPWKKRKNSKGKKKTLINQKGTYAIDLGKFKFLKGEWNNYVNHKIKGP